MTPTPKRKGTHKALLARQALRLRLELNRPVRGTRGLKNLAEELRRKWGGYDRPPELQGRLL